MKQAWIFAVLLFLISSCNNDKKIIVQTAFVDSLLSNFTESKSIQQNRDEIKFWKGRMVPRIHDFVNETKYASLLSSRFILLGDIHDIRLSDSILNELDTQFNYKEIAIKFLLLRNAITQHRFRQAGSFLSDAMTIGARKYEQAAASFDVAFESGHYEQAENDLRYMADPTDYGYQFRHSKLFHYKGELDSAIVCMQKAAELAKNFVQLRQAAISNEADLYLHDLQPGKAFDLYVQSLQLGSSDLHSLMGIGTIALLHDKNDNLAERIFQFVHSKTKSSDALFKLEQVAEQRGDSITQQKYAEEFVVIVSDSIYGNMYNKYTIQLYTGILNDPAKAEAIALREIAGRSNPQTYAWYVWALFRNNKSYQAYEVYKKYVSGKPLEGLEQYYMGKLMKSLNKGYNAKQFFDKAEKNKYDLSPSLLKDLAIQLEE